jgi:hypothetical protein
MTMTHDWTKHDPPPDTSVVVRKKDPAYQDSPADPAEYLPPTIRDTATVTVKAPVDGTVKRRTRGPNKPKTAVDTHQIRVRPDVWAKAKAICLPSQRLKIVSDTEVWVVNQ